MKMSKVVEVDVPVDDHGNIIVGEQLFMDLCTAWIERRGPTLLKQLLFKNVVKKYREESEDSEPQEKKRKL